MVSAGLKDPLPLGQPKLHAGKTAPRILIFSIVLGAKYSFYEKSIATRVDMVGMMHDKVLTQ